jgi:very-short-patch-repair endonuclease
MSRYSVGRRIAKQILKEEERKATGRRLQKEAAARPESIHVVTAHGDLWMSTIEAKLYDAMVKEGLSPIPQYGIDTHFADFAFPDIRLDIEADGAAYHSDDRREHDCQRDLCLRRQGYLT